MTPPLEQPEPSLGITQAEIVEPLVAAAAVQPASKTHHERIASSGRELSPGANNVVTALCGMGAASTSTTLFGAGLRQAAELKRAREEDNDESRDYERLVRLRGLVQGAPCAC